jgi:hypothetical protein
MLGWDQIVEVSREDARQTFLEVLEEVGFAATSWQEGSIPLAFVEVAADFWSRSTRVATSIKGFMLNDTSAGEALKRFSLSHYANEQLDAIPNTRRITLACSPTEGPHSIDLGAVLLSNADGKLFRNVEDPNGAFPASYPATLPSDDELTLIFEADEPGSASNTEDGGVNIIMSTLAGVTVSEDVSIRAGEDTESEVRLRNRNSLKWSLLTRFGLIDEAVVAIVLEADEAISRVAVNSTNPRGPGTFDVYVTAAEGEAGALARQAAFDAVRPYLMGPDGSLEILEAPLAPMDLAGTVYLEPGYDWDDVQPKLFDHLEAWRRTIPLGGFSFPVPGNRVGLFEIAHQIRRLEIGGKRPIRIVDLTDPTANIVVPSFGHVTRGDWDGLVPSAI